MGMLSLCGTQWVRFTNSSRRETPEFEHGAGVAGMAGLDMANGFGQLTARASRPQGGAEMLTPRRRGGPPPPPRRGGVA